MKLSKEEARAIIWESSKRFEVVRDTLLETTRWSVVHELVFRERETGKLYRTSYQRGATEHQDESPFEHDDPDIEEVVEVKREVVDYAPVAKLPQPTQDQTFIAWVKKLHGHALAGGSTSDLLNDLTPLIEDHNRGAVLPIDFAETALVFTADASTFAPPEPSPPG